MVTLPQIKSWQALLFLFLSGVVCGLLISSTCQRPHDTIDTPDSLMIRTIDKPTYPGVQDNSAIDSSTPIGEIPLGLVITSDSLPISVQGERGFIPFVLEIPTREYYGYNIRTSPMPFPIKITVPQPPRICFFVTGDIKFDMHKNIRYDFRGGIELFQHISLYGGVEGDTDLKAIPYIGCGYTRRFKLW